MHLDWRQQIKLWSTILVVVLLVRGFFFYQNLHQPIEIPGDLSRPYLVELEPGQSIRHFVARLNADGIAIEDFDLRIYARLSGQAQRIQSGEYQVESGMSPLVLLERLVRGEVYQHRLALIEGWTLREAIEAIQARSGIERTLDAGDREALRAFFGVDYYPEGLIFPDTYRFTRGSSDREILARARDIMQEVLRRQWQSRAVGLPYDEPYEALVMASIVEKETGLASERERIASVFVNRLHNGMRLQTDPTVIYGLQGDFDGNLTREDLRRDTPYNTYTNAGLPPTPIALPGREAIAASLNPAQEDYLYFVAKGDGSHHFSRTLEEHNAAVRRYQLGSE